MKNKDLFFWTCDLSRNSGEGKLASFFLEDLKKKYNIKKIKKFRFNINFIEKVLNYKYFLPFIGIIYCWKYHIKKKAVVYVNYLPLWNFLIFLLLPPKAKIGPITGGALYERSSIIRSIIFPILYKLSGIILYFRGYDLIFSTNLLKKYLSNKIIQKSKFNYLIKKFNFKNKKFRKRYDFLVYFRKHNNKKFPLNLIRNLIYKGFKVNVVGDRLDFPKVKNHGFLSNKKIINLQAKAKYSIFSSENIYTIFTLECITNNVLILIDKSNNYKLDFFKKSFIKINFNNLKELSKLKLISQ